MARQPPFKTIWDSPSKIRKADYIKLAFSFFLKLNNPSGTLVFTEEKMLEFYQYPKCSTCRNAQKWLEKRHQELRSTDITLTPPGKNELKRILKLSGKKITDLLNKSGEQYRLLNMKEKVKTMTEDQILELLSKNGRLIKRPLVTGGEKATIGFKEEEFGKTWK
jgi:arsenate reductase